MLRDQEKAKNQAYSQKLLQDCATSLKLEEQNKNVLQLLLPIVII